MKDKDLWNKIAQQWNNFRKKIKPEIKTFLKKQKGKILDLGCGSGRNFTKQKNLQWYAIDFSEEMITLARRKSIQLGIKARIQKAYSYKTGHKQNYFDAILCNAVLHCIKTQKGRKKTLQEIYRTLKPRKKAFISVWGPQGPRIKGKTGNIKIPWTNKGKKLIRKTYIYTKEELEKEIRETGLTIIKSWEDKNITIITEKPWKKKKS